MLSNFDSGAWRHRCDVRPTHRFIGLWAYRLSHGLPSYDGCRREELVYSLTAPATVGALVGEFYSRFTLTLTILGTKFFSLELLVDHILITCDCSSRVTSKLACIQRISNICHTSSARIKYEINVHILKLFMAHVCLCTFYFLHGKI